MKKDLDPDIEAQVEHAFGFDLSSDQWVARVGEALARREERAGASQPQDQPGRRIGAYELLEPIGSGGMGTVWRARRADKRPDRVVALKLIRSEINSQSAQRRFRLEEQVLARLEHPNIARLYDGGTTLGRPFFVMEFVEGIPITEYARRQELSIEARLALMQQVCEAVHYAHGSLVLHRDIKPGNILVTAEGTPKLLDFGIAKILDDESDGDPAITVTDARVLTPAYASPEQVRGNRLSTSTDVYSLGVVLYELLTNRLPYESETGSRHEIERAIIDQEPARPSAAALTAVGIAQGKRRRWARELRGDVDAICLQALAKSPSQRYRSAAELGEDIRRYLAGAPLLAKPPGLLTRVTRSLSRRRGVIIASVTGAALGLGLAAAYVVNTFLMPTWQEEHVRQARLATMGMASNNGIYNVLFFSWRPPDWTPLQPQPESIQEPLDEYAAAFRLGNVEANVAGEYAMLRLARDLGSNIQELEPIWSLLPYDVPITRKYVEYILEHQAVPSCTELGCDLAEDFDLRCLGLLAFRLHDFLTVVESWTRIPMTSPDPVVESQLGSIHLALDEGELAYPRLLSAYRVYPESGNVAAYLADAAIRCGDVTQAEHFLDVARTLAMGDYGGVLDRVDILILLEQDQFERVRERMCRPKLDLGPVLTVQVTHYVEETQGLEAAILSLAKEMYNGGNRRAAYAYFAALMEAWWTGLDWQTQDALIRQEWNVLPWDEDVFFDLMVRYRVAIRRLEELVKPGDVPPHELFARGRWAELNSPLPDGAHEQARADLRELKTPYVYNVPTNYSFCND